MPATAFKSALTARRGLTDIAERMAAASGRTYHLVSGAPVPVAALRTLALDYQHLHAPRFVPPETFEWARLTRAEQSLDRRVTFSVRGRASPEPFPASRCYSSLLCGCRRRFCC